ncbi:MAG: type II secretion system F family protein [Actinomycetota bacterium]|nr:type II secretion system F family protein [Actinomycetota bacterium]
MTPLTVVAAVSAGLAVWAVGVAIARPRRPIKARVGPYADVALARLGASITPGPQPVVFGEAARRILGPLATRAATRVAHFLRLGSDADVDLAIRQAGLTVRVKDPEGQKTERPMTVEDYRRRHLAMMIGVPLALTAMGYLEGFSTLTILVFAAVGIFFGARRLPDSTAVRIRRRRERIRNDLYSVAQLLAIRAQSGDTLLTAIQDLVQQGSGPVVDELRRALERVAAGYGAAAAFALLAGESAEPKATEFYRLLATATHGSVALPQNLLQLARDLRAQRREDITRASTRRQAAMVIPILVFMAPVMMLFISAPIPRAIFGP